MLYELEIMALLMMPHVAVHQVFICYQLVSWVERTPTPLVTL